MTTMTLPASADSWATLDCELARWLRVRTSLRAARDGVVSPLEGVANALRRMRATLAFVASGVAQDDARLTALVSRSYRWSIRIARELAAIEAQGLDDIKEWERFETFAPFALAFFESVLGAPFAAPSKSPDVARLKRAVDAVLAPIRTAMTSSAMAA